MTAAELLERLASVYPVENWWPSQSPFETAIGAILVQGVSWRNAARAIAELRAAGLLDAAALAAADLGEIAAAVRPALYHNQKARYLKEFAAFAAAAGGLSELSKLPRAVQFTALRGVRGIGDETAAAIMVYALGGAEPVVDAYARRLLPRAGAAESAADAAISAAMAGAIQGDPKRAQALHAVIVEHARGVCRKVPRCEICPIGVTCPRRLGETGDGR